MNSKMLEQIMEYDYLTEFEEINTNGLHMDSKLLIWCNTYNHAAFIEDALEGFVKQRTDFPFFAIVFDDASTDGTSDIVRQYAKEYPEYICAYIARTNTFGNARRKDMYRAMIEREFKGDYIAICEGDDCWVDRNKLQIQYDFMEKNREYAYTMHNSIMFNYKQNDFVAFNVYDRDMDLGYLDMLLRSVRLATASLVFRSEYYDMPDMFYNNGIGDYPRLLYLRTRGKGFYFDRIMTVYRVCSEGSWSFRQSMDFERQMKHLLRMCELLKKYDDYTEGHHKDGINFAIHRRTYGLLYAIECDEKITDGGLSFVKEMYEKYSSDILLKPELIKLIEQRQADGHCSKLIKDSIGGFGHIYIWGTGDGAQRLASQMRRDNVNFDGFVVESEESHPEVFFGKKVCHMREITSPKDETVIIVSIYNPISPMEARRILKKYGFEHGIFPFVMKTGI